MADLLKELQEWYRNCNPDLEGKPEWYVSLDDWPNPKGSGTVRLRGEPVVPMMVDHIRLESGNPQPRSAQLFCGFRGVGKSLELERLQRDLPSLGEFKVLRFKASDYFHMADAPKAEELALILAAGIGDAAEKQNIKIPSKTVWGRFCRFLSQEVALSGASLDLGGIQVTGDANNLEAKVGPLKFKGQLYSGLESKFREFLAQRPTALKDFLHGLVQEVATSVKPHQLVVLVDDLEKYNVAQDKVPSVYQAVAELFSYYHDLLQLPSCHVIYTVPPYIGFRHHSVSSYYGGTIRALPSIMVHTRPPGRACYDLGVKAMEEILSKRLDLNRLFGDERANGVASLVEASGGHIRDLLNLTREVVRLALGEDLPLKAEAVGRARVSYSNRYTILFVETKKLLQQIARRGEIDNFAKGDLESLTIALDQYLVLCYHNSKPWYDVHPLLWERIVSDEPETIPGT